MTTQDLCNRLKTLETEIASSDSATREVLVAQLTRTVRELEMTGTSVPRSARRVVEAQVEADVEAQFDNLPV